MTLISLILLGFVLGLRHALDADHVAAVASLACDREPILAVMGRGALWGCGHTFTLALAAAVVLIAGIPFPAGAEWWLELAVAIMLLMLGGDVIRRLLRDRVHLHTHAHADGNVHWHAHSHDPDQDTAPTQDRHEHRHHPVKTLAIGMLHGLAGSAALLLVVLDGVDGSWVLGMSYVLMFGIGSTIGMACLSLVIALPFRFGGATLQWRNRLSAATAVATLSVGFWLLWGLLSVEWLTPPA
jgi:ABC-type nickel/cobalt efflux system permease component RcnA